MQSAIGSPVAMRLPKLVFKGAPIISSGLDHGIVLFPLDEKLGAFAITCFQITGYSGFLQSSVPGKMEPATRDRLYPAFASRSLGYSRGRPSGQKDASHPISRNFPHCFPSWGELPKSPFNPSMRPQGRA